MHCGHSSSTWLLRASIFGRVDAKGPDHVQIGGKRQHSGAAVDILCGAVRDQEDFV